MKAEGEGFVADGAIVTLLMFNAFAGLEEGEAGDLLDALLEEGAEEEAGVGRAEAEMGAEAEGQMGVGLAVEPDFGRRLESRLVLVGRGPAEGDPSAKIGRAHV